MKKLIIGLTFAACSHSLFAACPNQNKTVFNCTTTNNKVIQVCDAGNTISYSFGKANATPELAIAVPRIKVTTYQWEGFGRYENYAINIPNGKPYIGSMTVWTKCLSNIRLALKFPITTNYLPQWNVLNKNNQ